MFPCRLYCRSHKVSKPQDRFEIWQSPRQGSMLPSSSVAKMHVKVRIKCYTGIYGLNYPELPSRGILGNREIILLYGWIVWNISELDCLMNEWVSVVWTTNFMRIFVIRNFPWTILARKLKLRVIPAGATWAFRTTPWRWTHGSTSIVAVWWLDHTGKNLIFRVSGWYLHHMNNVRVVSFIYLFMGFRLAYVEIKTYSPN